MRIKTKTEILLHKVLTGQNCVKMKRCHECRLPAEAPLRLAVTEWNRFWSTQLCFWLLYHVLPHGATIINFGDLGAPYTQGLPKILEVFPSFMEPLPPWVSHINTQKHSLFFWCLSAWLHSQDLNLANEGNPVCGSFWTRTWKHRQTNRHWRHLTAHFLALSFRLESHLKAGLMPMLSGCGRAGVGLLRQEDGGGKSFWYWDCICSLSPSIFTVIDWVPSSFSSSLPRSPLPSSNPCSENVVWDRFGSCWQAQVTSTAEQQQWVIWSIVSEPWPFIFVAIMQCYYSTIVFT